MLIYIYRILQRHHSFFNVFWFIKLLPFHFFVTFPIVMIICHKYIYYLFSFPIKDVYPSFIGWVGLRPQRLLRFGTTPPGCQPWRMATSLTRRMPNPQVLSSIELVTNQPTQPSSSPLPTSKLSRWVVGWRYKRERIKTILVLGKVRPHRPREYLHPQTPTREGESEVFVDQDLFSPVRNGESQTAKDGDENELSTPARLWTQRATGKHPEPRETDIRYTFLSSESEGDQDSREEIARCTLQTSWTRHLITEV